MPAYLDAFSLLYRAHYALPPLSTSAGEPTGALYGTLSLIVKILREHRPDGMAIAFDVGRTFRHEAYPAYKAGRPSTPDPLAQQIARFRGVVAAMGVPSHGVPGFEADDVLATLAARTPDCLVVSGDTDVLQVARAPTRVLFVGQRQRDPILYDQAAVEARYGVPIEGVAAWKALVGDKSDNLAGFAGIGQKTATAWVREHGDAAGILAAHPDRVDARLVRDAELVRLRTDLPLAEPLWAPVDLDGLAAACESLEMHSLVKRVRAL
ncbi:MAG: hypothetical protein H6737_22645 [Alphaproteobacteria bacterium]|nr:hypothetical protein [Alphaproteobacteria bacterium]